MSKKRVIAKFKSFMANMTPTDKVAVIHHTDCDGICSGFVTAEALERLGHKPVLMRAMSARELYTSLANILKKHEITKTICVDLVVDQVSSVAERVSEFSDLLVIDHHKIYNELKIDRVTLIKHTHLGIEEYTPASRLAYDLFSELVDLRDIKWIAAAGIINDMGYQQNKRFVDLVLKEKGMIAEKGIEQEITPDMDIFATTLGKAAAYIGYTGVFVPRRIKQALRVLKSSKHPKDIVASGLASSADELEAERDNIVDYVLKNAEHHDDLVFCIIESKYRVRGMVINKLSLEQYVDKTIILLLRVGADYVISARRQDRKVAVNDLLEEATKGLENAGGGGHAPAAGGQVMVKDLARFKKRLIKLNDKLREK